MNLFLVYECMSHAESNPYVLRAVCTSKEKADRVLARVLDASEDDCGSYIDEVTSDEILA